MTNSESESARKAAALCGQAAPNDADLDRVRAEQQLERLTHRLELILHSAAEGIYGIDSYGNTMFVNAAATRMVGWAHDELVGRPYHEIIQGARQDGNRYPRSESPVLATLDTGQPCHVADEVYWRKDGTCFPVEYRATPILENGAPVGAVVTFTDITERKRAEREAELRQQQMIQAAKMESMDFLVAGMAHEINNPNGLIRLAVPLLKAAWDSGKSILDAYAAEHGDFMLGELPYSDMRESIPELLGNILEGSERIRLIVEDLRTFSRPGPTDRSEVFSLSGVVNDAVALLSNTIKRSGADFKAECTGQAPSVRGNPQQLMQVAIHLMHNACEAIRTRGARVWIRTLHDPACRRVGFEICDEGVGIAQKDLPHLTDPFFTTKRDTGGKGLGLAVSSRIIKNHGGKLEIHSIEDNGTTARVWLPEAGVRKREN